jgi:hypothetical protein
LSSIVDELCMLAFTSVRNYRFEGRIGVAYLDEGVGIEVQGGDRKSDV